MIRKQLILKKIKFFRKIKEKLITAHAATSLKSFYVQNYTFNILIQIFLQQLPNNLQVLLI